MIESKAKIRICSFQELTPEIQDKVFSRRMTYNGAAFLSSQGILPPLDALTKYVTKELNKMLFFEDGTINRLDKI